MGSQAGAASPRAINIWLLSLASALSPFGMVVVVPTLGALARQFEEGATRNMGATGFPVPDPKPLPAALSDGIELAVCGAHMSGLPLNGELTKLGARMVRATKTAPHYTFFALAGGPPARPGLVRSTGSGASISVEVWSVPKSAFGAFIEGVPAPLAIGTVELADGTWVKGFVCEADGTKGAREITHLGDWRRFLATEMQTV